MQPEKNNNKDNMILFVTVLFTAILIPKMHCYSINNKMSLIGCDKIAELRNNLSETICSIFESGPKITDLYF
jgi:hypothetical protein